MPSVLSTYSSAIATILLLVFVPPIEIESCPMITDDVIDFVANNPTNYKSDPCFIEWVVTDPSGDAKEIQIWLERIIADYYRVKREREKQEQYDLEVKKIKQFAVVFVTAVIVWAAIVCWRRSTRNNPARSVADLHGESRPVQVASVATGNTHENQTTNDHGFSFLIVLPTFLHQQPETNVPSMPERKDSLPSYDDPLPNYDDAVRMSSALPPRE